MICLVAYRPEVWENVLGFELGLARTGMFIGVYCLVFSRMFDGGVRKTNIHKVSSLSLGALLFGGIIVAGSFWSRETFPYLDNYFLVSYTITNYLLGIFFGALLAALVWPKPAKEEAITI